MAFKHRTLSLCDCNALPKYAETKIFLLQFVNTAKIYQFEYKTSLPYFGVKLRKKAYSYPRVTYSYPKVTYSEPKVTFSNPKMTYSYPMVT